VTDSGTPLDASHIRHRMWPRLFTKAELRQVRLHDLRHIYYASLLIAQGESLTYVKEQLGHASIQTTVDVYRHLVPARTVRPSIGSTMRRSQQSATYPQPTPSRTIEAEGNYLDYLVRPE
jgi:integrase